MTQVEKEILLKDLCSRLPYKVKVQDTYYKSLEPAPIWLLDLHAQSVRMFADEGYQRIEYIKPYLFPLSSMTEEQKKELLELTGYEERCEESYGFDSCGVYINIVGEYDYEDGQESIILYPDDKGIDWCNKNHFDYRGLIPMGLAIDATGLNIY